MEQGRAGLEGSGEQSRGQMSHICICTSLHAVCRLSSAGGGDAVPEGLVLVCHVGEEEESGTCEGGR
eukprot:745809-Hanusia_phi.AAC.3